MTNYHQPLHTTELHIPEFHGVPGFTATVQYIFPTTNELITAMGSGEIGMMRLVVKCVKHVEIHGDKRGGGDTDSRINAAIQDHLLNVGLDPNGKRE